jgi:hypothetical protein
MEKSMKLYLNEIEQEVPLYTILTPALYDKVSPLLQQLANTKGAQTAAESEIMEKVFSTPHLQAQIDLSKGTDAFTAIMGDFRFQEIVKDAYLKVRRDLFDCINIDASTIPAIFTLVKNVINIKKIDNADLLASIQSEIDSEFWQAQDLDGILDELKFFRSTVCKRIRIS